MHTALRMPQNSLRHADFFYLQTIGGPKFRSISAASVAALIRTALKTVTNWRGWITQLEDAADRCLPANAVAKGCLSVSCWDSPPIAVNLRDAAGGLPCHPTWSRGLSEGIREIGTTNDGSWRNIPIQKLIYKLLVANRFGNTLNDTFERRLPSLLQVFMTLTASATLHFLRVPQHLSRSIDC